MLGPHRDRIQLSSKFGYVLDEGRQEHSEGERPQRWDGPFVRQALEASLRRLRHRPSGPLPAPQPAPRRDRLRRLLRDARGAARRGQDRASTASPSVPRSAGARRACGRSVTRRIASVQTVYNLLEQDPGRELMAAAAEHGVGVIARVPTSSGLLDDNLTPETTFGPGDHRRHRPSRVAGRRARRRSSGSASSAARDGPHHGPGGAALHPRPASDDRGDPDDHQPGRAARVRRRRRRPRT